jgi:hypothetical protein
MKQDSNYFLDKEFGPGHDYSGYFLSEQANEKIKKTDPVDHLDAGTFIQNFYADADTQIKKIQEKNSVTATKKFIRLLSISDKYIELLENIHKLNQLIANPQTYANIPEQERKGFQEHLEKTSQAAQAVAKPILSRVDLLDPTNLKHLAYLNKTVLAVTEHVQHRNPATLEKLQATSKNLDKLTVTRPVQILKGAIKVLVANSLRLLNLVGLLYMNYDTGGLPAGNRLGSKIEDKLSKISHSGFNDLMNTGNRANKSAATPNLQSSLKLFGNAPKSNAQVAADNKPADYSNDNKLKKR